MTLIQSQKFEVQHSALTHLKSMFHFNTPEEHEKAEDF